MIRQKKIILVTGGIRFGTSWTGNILSLSRRVGEIFEPLYPGYRAGIWHPKLFKYFFIYIDRENEKVYYNRVRKSINFNYNPIHAFKTIQNKKDFPRSVIKFGIPFYINRILNKRAVLKDPYAFFSAEWLHKTFNAQVVMLMRHPAAFVSSQVTHTGWSRQHLCYSLIQQPLLIKNKLKPFEEEIKLFADHETSDKILKNRKINIDRAILLWRIFATNYIQYKKAYANDWYFIRHEDLSLDPVKEFKKIYNYCDLDFNKKIEKKIIKYSFAKNKSPKFYELKRDSKRNLTAWKKRLTKAETAYIYNEVKDISKIFYSESEW